MAITALFLQSLLISLPALAVGHGPANGASFTWSSSSISAESETGTIQVQVSNPASNSTVNSHHAGHHNHTKKTGSRKLGAYYPVYNAEGQAPSQIRYDLYDELTFFAATTNSNFTIGTDTLDQSSWDSLAFDFVKRCEENSVFPTYSIGGWGGSRFFSSLVATSENRTAFANSTIQFAKKYGFRGIDLDWENPSIQGIGCNIVSEDDVQNQQLFMKEIKTQWPEVKLSTTASIAGIRNGDYQRLPASDLSLMAQYADEVRIMAYDVHGSWTKTTGPGAPLSGKCADPDNQLSVESAIEIYFKQGFKPEQLTLGIPAYAKTWTLASPELTPRVVGNYTSYYYQNFTGIPAGGQYDDKPRIDICGQQQGYGGSWLVSELVERGFLNKNETEGGEGFTRYYDECSGEPFLASKDTLVTYDDTFSTVAKVKYAKSKGLKGVFFFDSMGPLNSTVKAARKALLS